MGEPHMLTINQRNVESIMVTWAHYTCTDGEVFDETEAEVTIPRQIDTDSRARNLVQKATVPSPCKTALITKLILVR